MDYIQIKKAQNGYIVTLMEVTGEGKKYIYKNADELVDGLAVILRKVEKEE